MNVDDPVKISRKDAKLKRVKARAARDRFRERAFEGLIEVSHKFETDKEMKIMRSPYT